MNTSAFLQSRFDRMSSAERLAATIRKAIEDDVYAELARQMLRISTWRDRDALQALRELGYAPPFDQAEVIGAYPGYTLPDGMPGGDVLVFWRVDDLYGPEGIHVHIWDERGVCIDKSDQMVDHVRDAIWMDKIVPAYNQSPVDEERLQAHRSHADRIHDAELRERHAGATP